MKKYLLIVFSLLCFNISFANTKVSADIIAINHVCITVTDMPTMLHFYRDLLGFKIINSGIRSGEGLARGVGYADARLLNTKLRAPGGFVLELIQYLHPKAKTLAHKPLPINTAMINHIGIEVKNIDHVYQSLQQHHVKTISPPQRIQQTGAIFFYAYDPENNIVEFFQKSIQGVTK